MPAKRLPICRFLASAFALAMTIHTASADITLDLRASGSGTTDGGKSVTIVIGSSVQLEIWAQVTNTAPVNNIFGVQTILGAIVSSNDVGIIGFVDPMAFPIPFNVSAVPGAQNELSTPADTIGDLGTSSVTSTTNYPKARKDPAVGGEAVVPRSTMYATNNQPAGALAAGNARV